MSVASPFIFGRGISRGEKCIYRIELQFTHNNVDFGAIYYRSEAAPRRAFKWTVEKLFGIASVNTYPICDSPL